MSDNKYSKITLNQLDVDAIADYVVQSKKLVYREENQDKGFVGIAASSKAQDTEYVYGTPAENIAICTGDRHTVKRALELGDYKAEDYMTLKKGAGLQQKQEELELSAISEIQDIKDELYQLRNELVKKGVVDNNGQYAGFIDEFRRKDYKNIQEPICEGCSCEIGSVELKHVDLSSIEQFNKYDYIAIVNSNGNFEIKQIEDINDDSTIILDSALKDEVCGGNLKVYKSKGTIYNGMYCFATDEEEQVSQTEYHTGLSDDTYNVLKRINEIGKGFGYRFRIPEAKQGFLSKFEICAKATGTPGSLNCYIIDSRDVDKFMNPTQAKNDYIDAIETSNLEGFRFFARAKYDQLFSFKGKQYIEFDFLQDGSYPRMPKDNEDGVPVSYVAIIDANAVDANNYYDIVFLQHMNSAGELVDLELNNVTYNYKEQQDTSKQVALTTDSEINKYDMYYHVVTRGVTENEPEAQKQGLYTVHYDFFNSRKTLDAKKVRLSMRIKREGMYDVDVDNVLPTVFDNSSNALKIKTIDQFNNVKTIDDLRLKTEMYQDLEVREAKNYVSKPISVAIGNNICEINSFSSSSITPQTPVLTKKGDKVYRVAYFAAVKAREVSFVNGNHKIGGYDRFVMPLVEIIKDFDPVSKEYSDKLIFECDLPQTVKEGKEPKKYNDFEVQIFWENRELSNYPDIKKDQMGAIKDLILSFVRGCQ